MAFELHLDLTSNASPVIKEVVGDLQNASDASKTATAAMGAMGEAATTAGTKAAAAATTAAGAMDKMAGGAKDAGDDVVRLKELVDQLNLSTSNTTQTTDQAERSQKEWLADMDRVAKVLDSIKGPMREYRADVDALGKLLERGEITALEYGDALDAMTKRAGAWQGPVQQQAKTDTVKAATPTIDSAASAALDQQAKLLERIHAPMVQYEQDIATVTGLMSKGKLTTEQYNAELARINRQAGVTAGPVHGLDTGTASTDAKRLEDGVGALTSHLGPAGEVLQGFAASGAVATGSAIALGYSLNHLGNEYVELANKAIKLTAADGDINATLQQQLELSRQLHGSLDGTIELYDAVRDGTDELNISMRDQIELARDIGSSVVAAGGSIESASGLMSKLTFAFSTGSISGRELRSIMKQFPDIGAAFVESMGHSRKELIAMANSGQISADMLIETFRKIGPEMESKVGKRAETTTQIWHHFTDELTLSVGRIAATSGASEALSSALGGLSRTIEMVTDNFSLFGISGKESLQLLAGGNTINEFADAAKATGDALGRAGSFLGDFLKGLNETPHSQIKVTAEQEKFNHTLEETLHWVSLQREEMKLLGGELERNAKTQQIYSTAKHLGIDAGVFDEQFANKAGQARIVLKDIGIDIGDAFDVAHSKATLFADRLDKMREAKVTQDIADDAKRIWLNLEGANDVLDNQKKKWLGIADQIDVTHQAIMKLNATAGKSPLMQQDQRELQRHARDLANEQALSQYGKAALGPQQEKDQAGDRLRDLQRALKDGVGPAGAKLKQEYESLMTTLNDGRLPETIKFWNELHVPQEQFGRDTAALTALLKKQAITEDQYTQAHDKLLAAYVSGFSDAPGIKTDVVAKQREYVEMINAEQQIYSQIRDPLRNYTAGLAAASALLDLGRLNADQYAQAVDRVRIAYLTATPEGKTFEGALERLNVQQRDAGRSHEGAAQKYFEYQQHPQEQEGPDLTQDLVAYEKQQDRVGAKKDALTRAQEHDNKIQEEEKRILQDTNGALKQYELGLESVNQLYKDGLISADAYTRELAKIRAAYLSNSEEGNTFFGGIQKSWARITAESAHFGETIGSTLISDVDKLNESLVTMANNGTVSWKEMVDGMIQELERLIIKQLEAAAINALIAGLSGGSTAGLPIGQTVVNNGGDFSGALTSGGLVNPTTGAAGLGPKAYPSAALTGGPPGSGPTSSSPTVFEIHNHIDKSVTLGALQTREGRQAIANVIREVNGPVNATRR